MRLMSRVLLGGVSCLLLLIGCGGGGSSSGGATPVQPPTSLSYSTSPAVYTRGVAIAPNLPMVGGGAATAFTVSPALPAGLALNSGTGAITGTPNAITPGALYVVSVSNAGGTTSTTLNITVNDQAPAIELPGGPFVFTVGLAVSPLVPVNHGGSAVAWSLAPALPAGLNLNLSDGSISGIPTSPTAARNYTLTASNTGGTTTATVSIAVVDTPPAIALNGGPFAFTIGRAITPLVPTNTGGTVLSWSVTPTLPAGLSLNPVNGTISGTPTSASTTREYSLQASNTGGNATAKVTITVNEAPPSIHLGSGAYGFILNQPIAPLVPVNDGGPVATWSITPGLPPGLSMDGTNGTISGTPTTLAPPQSYSLQATNSGGSSAASVELRVIPPPPVITAPPLDQTVDGGQTATFTVTATGTGPLTYQWKKDGVSISGATSSTYTTPPLFVPDRNAQFSVLVSDSYGSSLTSPAATLGVTDPWPAAPEWTTFQGNETHTGYVPVSCDPRAFKLAWTTPPLAAQVALNPATAGAGKVFVSTQSYFGKNLLFALDMGTGGVLWSYDFGGIHAVHPPAFAGNRVYLTTSGNVDAFLWCFDAATGTPLFRSAYGNQWERYFAPIIIGDRVYMGGGTYGGMCCFDATNGTKYWSAILNQYDQWTPAYANGRVYAYTGSYSPKVSVLDASTGLSVGDIPDPGFVWNGWSMNEAPTLGSRNNLVAVQQGGSRLVSFDLAGSRLEWVLNGTYKGHATIANGVIFVFNNSQLEARSETDGSLLWIWIAPLETPTGTLVATQNLLFISTATKTYAVDLSTHKAVWSYPKGGLLAISQSGTLLISSTDGTVTAISVK